MSDKYFKERRVLPPDYPERARERIKEFFGLTDEELDAEFRKMRRSYDDPRRTPSKRALLKRIAKARAKTGKPLYG